MNCLKCGKETQNNAVFCESCLQSAKAAPVKPGTAIHLPHREALPQEKKTVPRRHIPTPAEQILQLRGTIRWLAVTVAVLSVVLCLTAAMLIHTLSSPTDTGSDLGRNYTTIDG